VKSTVTLEISLPPAQQTEAIDPDTRVTTQGPVLESREGKDLFPAITLRSLEQRIALLQ